MWGKALFREKYNLQVKVSLTEKLSIFRASVQSHI